MSKVLCYGSGIGHSLFALSLRKFRRDVNLTLVTNPRLPWHHQSGLEPGYLVITPPLVTALEELNLWEQLKTRASPVDQVLYYDCRSDEHFGTFDLRTLDAGLMNGIGRAVSRRRGQFLDELHQGFWNISMQDLKETIANQLKAEGVAHFQGELQTITQESDASLSAVINGKDGVSKLALDRLVLTQYHCPLPRDLPLDPAPVPTQAQFRPLRKVARSKIWDFRVCMDLVMRQPPINEPEWAQFRQTPNIILEFWDKDRIRLTSSIRRVTADPDGPVAARFILRDQVAYLMESTLTRGGWAQLHMLTTLIDRAQVNSEALKCVLKTARESFTSFQVQMSMKMEMLKVKVSMDDVRAKKALAKVPESATTHQESHLSRDWIHNTSRKDVLPPYIVPLCEANHSFLPNTFDLGQNHTLLEAVYAAKHWTNEGPAPGFRHHQFALGKRLRRYLRKMERYNYFRPWTIGKRYMITKRHDGRLRRALSGLARWKYSGASLPFWRRAFLE